MAWQCLSSNTGKTIVTLPHLVLLTGKTYFFCQHGRYTRYLFFPLIEFIFVIQLEVVSHLSVDTDHHCHEVKWGSEFSQNIRQSPDEPWSVFLPVLPGEVPWKVTSACPVKSLYLHVTYSWYIEFIPHVIPSVKWESQISITYCMQQNILNDRVYTLNTLQYIKTWSNKTFMSNTFYICNSGLHLALFRWWILRKRIEFICIYKVQEAAHV